MNYYEFCSNFKILTVLKDDVKKSPGIYASHAMGHWAAAVKVKKLKKSKQTDKYYLILSKTELQYVGVFTDNFYD